MKYVLTNGLFNMMTLFAFSISPFIIFFTAISLIKNNNNFVVYNRRIYHQSTV